MKHELPATVTKFILHFLKPYKWLIAFALLCAMGSGTYITVHSYLLKYLIDTINTTNPENLFQVALIPAILLVLNISILNDWSWRGIDWVNYKIAAKIKGSIIETLFAYVHQHSYSFFQNNFTGSITSNIGKLADNIVQMVSFLSLYITRGFIQLFLCITSVGFINPILSLSFVIWAIIFLAVSFYYSNKVVILADNVAESEVAISGQLSDSISATTNVRLFAREKYEANLLKSYIAKMKQNYQTQQWFLLKLQLAQGLSITLLIATVVYVLLELKSRNLVTIGDIVFVLNIAMYITENMWWIMSQFDSLNEYRGQCRQGLKMLVEPQHEIIDQPDAKELVVSKGEICFQNVSFKYDKSRAVFGDLSLTIKAGKKVGLVGYSGSGKSSFVNLIVRLFDLSSGKITIDDQDIAAVTQMSLRNSISFIPQDPILFHRSLLENIRYGKIDASNEQVMEVAKKAHIHDFILETAEGYNTLVGERGVKLSGGQRQRIAIARAMLKNAPILILDEATSSLDSVTENIIQQSLKVLMQKKTVIVIAHRLSTLLAMDEILVFDRGKIVEEGDHQKLLNKNGLYAKLWNSQVGGFIRDKVESED